MTAKADRAQELMDDPIIQEAFNAVREKYRDMIEQTPVATEQGKDAIMDIRKMLQALRDVEQHLRTFIDDGRLEDFNVLELEKAKKERKRWLKI